MGDANQVYVHDDVEPGQTTKLGSWDEGGVDSTVVENGLDNVVKGKIRGINGRILQTGIFGLIYKILCFGQ